MRLFWLGMHELLVRTELERFRILGYEVFNPPYLSDIKDQSVSLKWNPYQESTLPIEIFKKLSGCNFFYSTIPEEILEILNEYFDAVIVTIAPDWLDEIIKGYRGKIIYRTYGQHGLLSDELHQRGLLPIIQAKDDFWFVPHAEEALSGEHDWIKERMRVVPYCLGDEVFVYKDMWDETAPKSHEISLTCPNIDNEFFKSHYDYLIDNFSDKHYLYYGRQLREISQSNIVGTLDRDVQLQKFLHSKGYLYTYSDPRVCYLPPIEMMTLGGPVLFLEGSLLDSFMPQGAPGRCRSVDEAKHKVSLLLNEDKEFVKGIISSQSEVRKYYSPEYVWPTFDRVFQEILETGNMAPNWLIYDEVPRRSKSIYVLHHFPGEPVVLKDGVYAAYDGIPRVVRHIVHALAERDDVDIIITATNTQIPFIEGYFRSGKNNIRILNIDCLKEPCVGSSGRNNEINLKRIIKNTVKAITPKIYHKNIFNLYVRVFSRLKLIINRLHFERTIMSKSNSEYINYINSDSQCLTVFVPHYYCFPESLDLDKIMMLYLPDYMPHFFHNTGEFVGDEGVHTEIGKKIVNKAKIVLCNSFFTKSYLPGSRLSVDADKIRVLYLPMLNGNASGALKPSWKLKSITDKQYLFYPTQPRPNKNLGLLLRVFNQLVEDGYDLHLVLTSELKSDPKAYALYKHIRHRGRVKFSGRLTDEELKEVYIQASAVCFTSLAEGNFPPQIQEAITYAVPVVAGRLGFITERIPDDKLDSILLCTPNDEEEFVEKCKEVLDNRDYYSEKISELQTIFDDEEIKHQFGTGVQGLFFDS